MKDFNLMDLLKQFGLGALGGLTIWLLIVALIPRTARQVVTPQSDIYGTEYVKYIEDQLLMVGTDANIDFNTSGSGETIISSAADQLDIDATTQVEITTAVLDLKGRLDVGTGFWADAPSPGNNDLSVAYFYEEDFFGNSYDSLNTSATGLTSKAITGVNANFRGWKFAGDAGAAITQAAGTLGGIIAMTPVTASNNEAYMQLGALGTETYVEITGSSGLELWVEFQIATDDITASAANFFVGLAEEGSAAADFINDSGADIADKDVLGFVSWEATMDSVRLIYQTAGGAFAVGTGVALTTAMQTLGIYFDGVTTITWYVDGTSVGTVETSAALVPDTEELSPLIGIKNGAQDRIVSVDWVKIVGER